MSIKHFRNAFCTECEKDTLHYKTICRECGNPLVTNYDAYHTASQHILQKTALLNGNGKPHRIGHIARGAKLRTALREANVKKRLEERSRAIWRQLDKEAQKQRCTSKAGLFGRRPWK